MVLTLCAVSVSLHFLARDLRNGLLRIVTFVILYATAFFFFIPALYLLMHASVLATAPSSWVLMGTPTTDRLLHYDLMLILACSSALLGWLSGSSGGQPVTPRYAYPKREKLIQRRLVALGATAALILFLEGMHSGGLTSLMQRGEELRAHGASWFVGPFYRLVPLVVTTVIALSLMRGPSWYALLVVSVVALIVEQSRTNTVMFFCAVGLVYLNQKRSFAAWWLLLLAVSVVAAASFGNEIIESLNGAEWQKVEHSEILPKLISQLSPTFTNGMLIAEFTSDREFQLFAIWADLIPMHLLGTERDPLVWQDLSVMYFGDFSEVGMQIDMVSYGYTQLGYLGVAIMGLVYGAAFGFLARICEGGALADRDGGLGTPAAVLVMLLSGSLMVWGSLDSAVLAGNLKYILVLAAIFIPPLKFTNWGPGRRVAIRGSGVG